MMFANRTCHSYYEYCMKGPLVKECDVDKGQRSTAPKRRQSGIELLRIIAMLMIIGYHAVTSNSVDFLYLHQLDGVKFFYELILGSGGWIGNVCFFTISAWFIAGSKNLSIRKNLRRAWLLEREVLFWSLTLCAVFLLLSESGVYHVAGFGSSDILQSLLPTATRQWWYVTSYMLFLVASPVLVRMLRSLDRKTHALLAVWLLIIWGVLTLIPNIDLDYSHMSTSVLMFMYWFVLISYYRWHMRPFSTRACWAMIIVGYALYLLYWMATNLLTMLTGKLPAAQGFIILSSRMPTLLVGFGLFLLFERLQFSSRVVNYIATSTFAVYLIHVYPASAMLLWYQWFPLKFLLGNEFPVFHVVAVILTVFVACIVADMVRKMVFAIVMRTPGRWFDRLWDSHPVKRMRDTFIRCIAEEGRQEAGENVKSTDQHRHTGV